MTRLVHQNGHQGYQVYRQPIPLRELSIENLKDGEVKIGSFRSAFGNGQTGKYLTFWLVFDFRLTVNFIVSMSSSHPSCNV